MQIRNLTALPADSNIINSCTEVHTGAIGTSRHCVPNCASQETEESKAHEKSLRGINDVLGINEGYQVNAPKQEWDQMSVNIDCWTAVRLLCMVVE